MEYSKNFDFALPSSANDVDLADINEISNNFRKIDENAVKKEDGKGLSTNDFTDADKSKLDGALSLENIDQSYNPTSENAQSGVAVAEALSGVNGIKYITEQIEAKDLEFGLYFIDGNNGGYVTFYINECDNLFRLIGASEIYEGVIIVSPSLIYDKAFSVFTSDTSGYYSLFNIGYLENQYSDTDITIYANKNYVDEKRAALQAQIGELREQIGGIENGSY